MKKRKYILISLLLVSAITKAYSGWKHGDPIPKEIAPIKAPFEMPQLKRAIFRDVDYNIKDYGAKQCKWDADTRIHSTDAIHWAIEECNKNGGGRVIIPTGDWITGAVHLKSNVNLHLQEGATLHFSDNPNDYLPVVLVRWEGVECYNYSSLIYASHCENIAITGKGILNGHGEKWWPWKSKRNRDRIKAAAQPLETREFGLKGGIDSQRPAFVNPMRSKNVLIEDITLIDPPFWSIQITYCENIIVRGIKVDSRRGPNGDGINFDSSINGLLEYNYIQSNDDAVCLKSGLNEDGLRIGIPSENIVARHYVAQNVMTGSGGFVIGSEMSGGVRNVYIHDALFLDCDRGIRLKSVRGRGGVVENIYFKDVTMSGIRMEAVRFTTTYQNGIHMKGPVPLFRHIYMENVQADKVGLPMTMNGLPDAYLEDISIINSSFTECQKSGYIENSTKLYFENVKIHRTNSDDIPLVLERVSSSVFKGMDLNKDLTMKDCADVCVFSYLNVLPNGADSLLFVHLRQESKRLHTKREAELEVALRSSEAVRKRSERLQRDYRRLIGQLLQTMTLNPVVTGIIECDGYSIDYLLCQRRTSRWNENVIHFEVPAYQSANPFIKCIVVQI